MSAIYYWDNLFVRLSDVTAVRKVGTTEMEIWVRGKEYCFKCTSNNQTDRDADFEKLKQGVIANPGELLQWQT